MIKNFNEFTELNEFVDVDYHDNLNSEPKTNLIKHIIDNAVYRKNKHDSLVTGFVSTTGTFDELGSKYGEMHNTHISPKYTNAINSVYFCVDFLNPLIDKRNKKQPLVKTKNGEFILVECIVRVPLFRGDANIFFKVKENEDSRAIKITYKDILNIDDIYNFVVHDLDVIPS